MELIGKAPKSRKPRPIDLDRDLIAKRFWPKVEKGENCWIWKAFTTYEGYGRLSCTQYGKEVQYLAHRVSWWLFYGDDPGLMEVCHACDTPPCVRPDHLFLGTQADNLRDMYKKGRNDCSHLPKFLNGEANINAVITKEDAAKIKRLLRDGHRKTDIASYLNVSVHVVKNIARGATWNHVLPEM